MSRHRKSFHAQAGENKAGAQSQGPTGRAKAMVGNARWDLGPQEELRPRGGMATAGEATRGRMRERPALAFLLFPPFSGRVTHWPK